MQRRNRLKRIPALHRPMRTGALCALILLASGCSQQQIQATMDRAGGGAQAAPTEQAPPRRAPPADVPARRPTTDSREPVQAPAARDRRASADAAGVPPARDAAPGRPGRSQGRPSPAGQPVPLPAAQRCVAADTLEQALAVLPKDQQEPLRTLVGDGGSLSAQRKQWQDEVRRSKSNAVNMRLPTPNYGCNNPGLGSALQQPDRTNANTIFHDPDCAPDAGKDPGKLFPARDAAQASAREAHFAQVARLKSLDVELSRRELQHAASLAAQLQQATAAWTSAGAASLTVPTLAGMDLFRDKVVLACAAAHGRLEPGVQQNLEAQKAALGRLYDDALRAQTPAVATGLHQADSMGALNALVTVMFPTEFLLSRALAQAGIERALSAEKTRVAARDGDARAQREAAAAAANKVAFDNSPDGRKRKRYLDNVTANGPLTAEDMMSVLVRAVFDEHTGDRANSGFTFTEDGEIEFLTTLPIVGT